MKNNTSILNRAKKLSLGAAATLSSLGALQTAEANNLTLDYSFSSEYSNSGWFMRDFRDNEADGITLSNGFKLWGEMERTDESFWEWSEYYEQTVPRSDITGFAMAWGGRILGPTTWDDKLETPYEFSLEYSHHDSANNPNAYRNVSAELTIGYSYDPFTFEEYNMTPQSNAANYQSNYYYFDTPGKHMIEDEIEVWLEENDGSNQLYWFALLTTGWDHENSASWYWEDDYSNRDGDTLNVIVPQNSIDVMYNPVLASNDTSAVPDNGSFYLVFALLGAGILYRSRKH